MRPSEVEAWALSIIDRVNAGEKVEDDRVELKREWPDPVPAARRIAAHANTARGDDILWLIGVDEKTGLLGADEKELSSWYPQVEARFDSIAPTLLHHLNVPSGATAVVALVFDGARAPYVVKTLANPGEKGVPEREVPWREGTRTRSAKREDLLRILVPLQRRPRVDVLDASLGLRRSANSDAPVERFSFIFRLYLVPMAPGRICFPAHRLEGSVSVGGVERPPTFPLTGLSFNGFALTESRTAHASQHELLVDGPCLLEVTGAFETAANVLGHEITLDARLSMPSADDEQSVSVSCELQPARFRPQLAGEPQLQALWKVSA